MKTGFIGLGHLGSAMAKRLISEGVDAGVLKKPFFTGSIVKELYGMTFAKHIEDLDFSAIFTLYYSALDFSCYQRVRDLWCGRGL